MYFVYFAEDSNSEGHASSKDSNNLLFSLLSEQLHGNYQRQVKLSQEQSRFFLDQLYARPRSTDTNPFSFDIEKFISQGKEKMVGVQTQTVSKETGSNLSKGKKTSHHGVQRQDPGSEVKVVPEWNCFMKSVNNSSLMLVFLPASFDDLVLLNEKVQVGELEAEETEEKAVVVNVTVQASSDQSDKDDHFRRSGSEQSDKSSECVTAESDIETTVTSTKDETESDTSAINRHRPDDSGTLDVLEGPIRTDEELVAADVTEEVENKVEIKEKKKPASEPLVLPVYIYDCIIHNVLDSLINPWDFQMPPDTYQDMTFDFQEEAAESGGRVKRVSISAENQMVISVITLSIQTEQVLILCFNAPIRSYQP